MENNNLLIHYKTRNPIDTVNKVKNFFINNGFITKEILNNKTESGTYYCRIELYKNSQYIIGTNGKGMTEEYSLASGYGELYERFCNKIIFLLSDISYYKLEDLQLLTNNDLRPFEQICELYPLLLDWAYPYFRNDLNTFKEYYLKLTHNKPQADTFISFDNSQNTPVILDSKLLLKMTGSKGMVAGNSLEEALNQGISELYESWAHENLYLTPPDKYYALSDNVLKKLPIWENICKIRELGYSLYVIDLGYNYNCPVIATYLINPKAYSIYLNIGCFPVLDIAVERTITELYQGIDSFTKNFLYYDQVPYRSVTPAIALSNNGNNLDFLCYDEQIFNNIVTVDKPSESFLFNSTRIQYTNIEINNYFKELNKQHNFHFYFKNNSLSEDMTALYIICLDMKPWRSIGQKFRNVNNIFRKQHLNEVFLHFDIANSLLYATSLDDIFNKFTMLFKEIQTNINRDGGYIGSLDGGDPLNFYAAQGGNTAFAILDLLFGENGLYNNELLKTDDIIYSQKIKKYIFILNYKQAGYSDDEIKQFYTIFNSADILLDEDLNNIYDPTYLFNTIFLQPFRNYYNSKDYEGVLKIAFGSL